MDDWFWCQYSDLPSVADEFADFARLAIQLRDKLAHRGLYAVASAVETRRRLLTALLGE